MIGQTISHYHVVSRLGAGGMGVVFGADDTRLGRQVALKFIPEDLARDRQAIDRFRVEARAASALNHANICTIHDIGEHDGQPFIVMEWLKGQTLYERLSATPLKVMHIVDIGIEIADALDAAHSQGILHRDVKPANIFLTERGHVKVMDFGLAKLMDAPDQTATTADVPQMLTLPGSTLGTASYMSPEQAAGDPLDGRSDLFSLGIVLYECATGRRPFTGESARVILAAVLHREPVAPALLNPDLPLKLQDIINCLLEKDPDLRYQNAAGLRADLKRLKRDLESGRTIIGPPFSDTERAAAVAGPPTAPPVANVVTGAAPAARPSMGGRGTLVAIGATIGIAIAAALYFQRSSGPVAPAAANAQVQSAQANRDQAVPPVQAPAVQAAAALAPPESQSGRVSPQRPAPPPKPLPNLPAESARDSGATLAAAAPQVTTPQVTSSPPDPPPVRIETPEAAPPSAAAMPPPASTVPASAPPAAPAPSEATPGADRAGAEDDGAIRSVVVAYARAIESKDLALFRSLKPNMGAEEERRIQQGFKAVNSQKVNITILSVERHDDRATVQLRRQDVIEAGGRRQAPESRQTMTMARRNGAWVIVEIGR
jgi:predicted Ser/Thr protein kinase